MAPSTSSRRTDCSAPQSQVAVALPAATPLTNSLTLNLPPGQARCRVGASHVRRVAGRATAAAEGGEAADADRSGDLRERRPLAVQRVLVLPLDRQDVVAGIEAVRFADRVEGMARIRLRLDPTPLDRCTGRGARGRRRGRAGGSRRSSLAGGDDLRARRLDPGSQLRVAEFDHAEVGERRGYSLFARNARRLQRAEACRELARGPPDRPRRAASARSRRAPRRRPALPSDRGCPAGSRGWSSDRRCCAPRYSAWPRTADTGCRARTTGGLRSLRNVQLVGEFGELRLGLQIEWHPIRAISARAPIPELDPIP